MPGAFSSRVIRKGRDDPVKLLETHLGHEDEFASKTIPGVGIVVIDPGYRNSGLFAEIADCCHLRFRLETRHEPPSYSRD